MKQSSGTIRSKKVNVSISVCKDFHFFPCEIYVFHIHDMNCYVDCRVQRNEKVRHDSLSKQLVPRYKEFCTEITVYCDKEKVKLN